MAVRTALFVEGPRLSFAAFRRPPEDDLLRRILFAPETVGSPRPDDAATDPPAWACDGPRLVEKAQREGISEILFHRVRQYRLEGLLPPEVPGALSRQYQATLKRNLSLVGEMRKILAAFEKAGIPSMVLKGLALAELVYPNIALRGMSDVDVLVRKEDLFRAEACLASLGYASRDGALAVAVQNPTGYLASLEYGKERASPLLLHLHWHPVNTSVPATAFAAHIDVRRLWSQAVKTRIADRDAWMLCPEHLLLYLCEHALRVGHSFDRLLLVCDIFFAVQAFAGRLDWAFLVEESRRFQLSRLVFHALSIVQHYTALAIPHACLAALRPRRITPGERLFLRLQFRDRRIRGSSYFVHLAMNETLREKARFVLRTLFPPPPILLQRRYRKEGALLAGLYVSRIREVLSALPALLAAGGAKRAKRRKSRPAGTFI